MYFRWWRACAMTLALSLIPVAATFAHGEGSGPAKSRGQLVYVSAYSHVYILNDKRKLYLSVTLSFRNTDPDYPVTVRSIRYYDSGGQLVREFIDEPVTVPPLATVERVVGRSDKSGGSGANFLLDWSAEQPVSPPIIESVMVSAGAGSSALGFARSGHVIQEHQD